YSRQPQSLVYSFSATFAKSTEEFTEENNNYSNDSKNEFYNIQFTPQIVPMNRGILSNIYFDANVTRAEILSILQEYYNKHYFVYVLDGADAPTTRDVLGTNQCRMAVFNGRKSGKFIITSVIDNLVKGAAGQAMQNFNIMFDFSEFTGLDSIALFP
ncbi:MAG: Asd/ArgC dimerization domain-containing protein, partial [Pseudomonadota bacterium]